MECLYFLQSRTQLMAKYNCINYQHCFASVENNYKAPKLDIKDTDNDPNLYSSIIRNEAFSILN